MIFEKVFILTQQEKKLEILEKKTFTLKKMKAIMINYKQCPVHLCIIEKGLYFNRNNIIKYTKG